MSERRIVTGRDGSEAGATALAESSAERPGDGGNPAAVGPRQFPGETDGPKGPEPTRFGDWEKGGRCTDF